MAISINGTTGISGIDGSAAAPGVRGSDADTGISFGTDTAAISTAGSSRLTVDASGNVGIGATASSLTVNASGKVGIGATAAALLDVGGNCASNIVAVSALDIDCSLGNYFTKTITTDSTFSISNVPSSRSFVIVVEVTHTGGNISWPNSVYWATNNAPSLTAGKTHIFVLSTNNGGTRWRGSALVDYVN